jgi:uncharacterized membrane protein
MLKKSLISFVSSLLAVVLLVIIELSFIDMTQFRNGDYAWVALWLILAFFPVLFALPFFLTSINKKNEIRDFVCTVFTLLNMLYRDIIDFNNYSSFAGIRITATKLFLRL